MQVRAFVAYLAVCVASVMMLASAVRAQSIYDVTTWHNNINRTGLQPNETILTPTAVRTSCAPASSSGFCLLWQDAGTQQTPMGRVFAQPLAVGNVSSINGCNPCNLLFIAEDQDNIWAYDANSNNLKWSVNLADLVQGDAINCNSLANQYPGFDFGPCDAPNYPGNTIGVIGTPVIDTNAKVLYVVAPIFNSVPPSVSYDLFAISITNPTNTYWTAISGSVTGNDPGKNDKCANGSSSGTIVFDSDHIQRSALLLLTQSGTPTVYIAFAPGGSEWENGWLFGYTLNGTTLTRTSMFVTTPNGTGGGIWGSGAGPASNGTDIYVTTGNGTFDYNTQTQTAGPDYGDSVLRLGTTPSNGLLPIKDFFTPSDVFNYREPQLPLGLCPNDVDLGSGGILIFPDAFYESLNLMVSADKQSNLYFENLANLGQFNSNGVSNNNIETILTPNSANGQNYPQPNQGYWSNPAYWKYVSGVDTYYELYYAVQTDAGVTTDFKEAPYPIYQYTLSPSASSEGPLSTSVNAAAIPTPDLFCFNAPTLSVSSYNNTGGVLWAIENQNGDNPGNPADCNGSPGSIALHAYDATNINNRLYTSHGHITGFQLGHQVAFPVPTIFNGRVYVAGGGLVNGVGQGVVSVFGMCNEGMNGTCPTQ